MQLCVSFYAFTSTNYKFFKNTKKYIQIEMKIVKLSGIIYT